MIFTISHYYICMHASSVLVGRYREKLEWLHLCLKTSKDAVQPNKVSSHNQVFLISKFGTKFNHSRNVSDAFLMLYSNLELLNTCRNTDCNDH